MVHLWVLGAIVRDQCFLSGSNMVSCLVGRSPSCFKDQNPKKLWIRWEIFQVGWFWPQSTRTPWNPSFLRMLQTTLSHARMMNLWRVAADATSYLDDATMHRNIQIEKSSNLLQVLRPALRHQNQQSGQKNHLKWKVEAMKISQFPTTIQPNCFQKSVEMEPPKQKQLHWISGRWFTNPPDPRFSQVDDEHEEKVSAEKMKALSPQIFDSDVFCAGLKW